MDLQFIKSSRHNEDAKPYELHFLVDMQSERVYGYVETPLPTEMMFYANPYEGKSRWYLTFEAAASYLQQVAIEQDAEDQGAFQGRISRESRSEGNSACFRWWISYGVGDNL